MSTTPGTTLEADVIATPSAGTTAATERDDRMPAGILFIIVNEFAERFCYYGINAILTVYMTQFLRIGDADATKYHSLFKTGAYFFPLLGAVISDVFWGKFRTIITFSLAYALGCGIVAFVPGQTGLFVGLFLVAFGTGGIKPCVSTNVGDQFTSKNQHLIERAFSYFYLAINAGSSISIYFCPILLEKDGFGPRWAFGIPAVAMFIATAVFWSGRKKFAIVPPAGKAWLKDILSPEGLKTIGSLAGVFAFVAFFWALWEQSNGQTWTLQAQSNLMDKDIGFGFVVRPAQIQVVNGFFILGMVPIFTFGIYPLVGKVFKLTPLRKIGAGLFLVASSFLIVSWIEAQIQGGHKVSVWWQIVAYMVLSASEVLVSITALEFAYKQAPLKMKSFVMSLFLLSASMGNLVTYAVNNWMVLPVDATGVEVGAQTWVTLAETKGFVVGQKIDFADKTTGLEVLRHTDKGDKTEDLAGTYLVAEIDQAHHRVELMDAVNRLPVQSSGTFTASAAKVTTYKLVGPQYFNFFAELMAGIGVLFVLYAMFYKERTHVRTEEGAGA